VPALSLIVVLGGLSAYTFGLYGRLVHFSQAKSLGEVWEKEKGTESAWIISVSTLTFCFGGALAYSILLGDAFASLAGAAGLTGIGATRQCWIVLLSATVLFPLCNLKSLLALAPLSIAGVISVLTTAGFLGWRCPAMNAASPYASPGGVLLATLTSKQSPVFGTFNKGIPSLASMVLVGMSATSYLAHFSAPGFYHSLRTRSSDDDDSSSVADAEPHPQTLRDYFRVTRYGFGVCTLVNCLIMAFGYLTFGGNCQGVILNNYSTTDIGASICRLLMAVCVAGGYPFLIGGCRSEFLALWKRKSNTEPSRQIEQRVTTILLSLLTSIALVMDNAGFVIGFTGAVVGSGIAYSFPSLLYLSRTKKQKNMSPITRLERLFCRLLIGFGIVSAVIGGAVSLVDNLWPHLLK
jgi:sodium-coupled neutral amino acid transporter 11